VPPALFLLALTALAVGFARPHVSIMAPSERATIVLAIDSSGSMMAEDVKPTRFVAAQEAVRTFLDDLPPKVRVGMVTFAAESEVVAPPTTDRTIVRQALEYLVPLRGTAIGDAVARAAEELGAVDVLVFTAATNVRKPLLDYTAEEFERVVALNLRASFDLVRAFGRGMAERGSGSIIGFSSIRAVAVEPGQGVYAATKAGLVQLLRTAAAELGPSGVRVNTIAPGVVDTPLTAQIKAVPEWSEAYATKSALGRWSRADELAGAVVYLASDASSFVTGSQLFVDGGWTAIDGRYTPPN
jgi:NAD(P)-dependent dehydrogenase (short-subunit alcohol dehydrogenase family)